MVDWLGYCILDLGISSRITVLLWIAVVFVGIYTHITTCCGPYFIHSTDGLLGVLCEWFLTCYTQWVFPIKNAH